MSDLASDLARKLADRGRSGGSPASGIDPSTAGGGGRPSLQPLVRGRLRLANRIAFLATVNNLGRNDLITEDQVTFYEERARGGCGLIITEGLAVHPTAVPNETVPLAFDASLMPGLGRIADAAHRHGAAILGQLWHAGRQALWNPTMRPWGPSDDRDPYSGTTPHAMNEEEIKQVIDAFALTAGNLQACGFDGVEVHGAHGYLITQFLSPWSNRRADRWGGSTENRARLVAEVIEAVRAKCGPAFVVGLKLSVHEYVEGGLDLAASRLIIAHLGLSAPPDYFAVSQANFSPSIERHVPDMRFPDAPFVDLALGIRDSAGEVPVMALAKIPDLDAADHLLSTGTADLIGMSRPLIADAQHIAKARAGIEPRPCIYCNVCWHRIHTHQRIMCIYGPDADRTSPRIRAASSIGGRKEVHVIGAGPAGLEVARVAAERGGRVVVHEATLAAGGRLAAEARIPGRETVGRAAHWLEDEVRRLGGTIEFGTAITPDDLAAWDDHAAVVVAIGAEPVVEPLPGAATVLSLQNAVARPDELSDPIVIVDEVDDEPVYAAAELLRARGHRVTIVTRRPEIGRQVAYVSLIGVLRRLDALGIRVEPLAIPVMIDGTSLVARHPFSGRERHVCEARTIVRAGPFRSRRFELPLNRRASVVGDASSPRPLVAIMREANAIGESLWA